MRQIKMLAVLILCISLLAGCGQGLPKDPLTTYVPETTIEPTVIPATINLEDNVTLEEIADSLAVENISPYTAMSLS